MNELVILLGGVEILVHVRHAYIFKHVDNEYGVVCSERTATLGNEVRVRNVVFVGCIDKSVDAVVDVFLNRVVDRTFRIAGTCAVVVNP